MHEVLNRYLGTDRLSFMAIDGSCQKQQFSDFITFSGVAYGSKEFLVGWGETPDSLPPMVFSRMFQW